MNTQEPFVITISRELGSGGRTLGKKLAAQLGVRFSDKDLIESLREKYGLSTYEIEKVKGKKRNWLSDMLDIVAPLPNNGALISPQLPTGIRISQPKSEEIFQAESEILHAIAAEGSCVIAGRSGFYVFKDHPNKLNIFIQAPMEERIKRVMKKQGLSRTEAETVIKSVDESRETFVKKFAGVSRYDCRNYDLVLNVGNMSDEEAILCILKYIKGVSR